MPRNHTHLTWEEQIKRRRETMDPYYGVIVSNSLYMERFEMKHQKEIQRRTVSSPFNFLQYWNIVSRCTVASYGISRQDLEFLLYLQPVMLFTRKEFKAIERSYGITDYRRFDNLKEGGYITYHSEHAQLDGRKQGKATIWTISHKSNKMITSIHRRLLFLEPLPESIGKVGKIKKEVDNYDRLLEEFNKKVREKQAEK